MANACTLFSPKSILGDCLASVRLSTPVQSIMYQSVLTRADTGSIDGDRVWLWLVIPLLQPANC